MSMAVRPSVSLQTEWVGSLEKQASPEPLLLLCKWGAEPSAASLGLREAAGCAGPHPCRPFLGLQTQPLHLQGCSSCLPETKPWFYLIGLPVPFSC